MFNEAWESFKRLIVPKSHAEAMVDEIYGEYKGLPPPYLESSAYYPSFSMFPDVVVKPVGTTIEIIGGAVESVAGAGKKFGGIATDYITKLAIWVFAAAIVLVIVYAFAKK